MLRYLILIFVLLVLNDAKAQLSPPIAKKIPKEIKFKNKVRIDDYYWMNESKSSEMVNYLNAENEYLATSLKQQESLRNELFNEMVARTSTEVVATKYEDNGYIYTTKIVEGKEYPIYYRTPVSSENNLTEELILDINLLASNHKYFKISNFGLSVSPDNKFLAFAYETESSLGATIKVKDLTTGNFLPDEIQNTTGDPTWANDNKTLFYSIPDKNYRSYKVKKHTLGAPVKKDMVVFHDKSKDFDIYVYKSKSKKYIIIRSFGASSLEYLTLNADNPDDKFKVFQNREPGLEYSIQHYQDKFYIHTNLDDPFYRIMVCPEKTTSKENWSEVLPNTIGCSIFNFDVFKNHIITEELHNGLTQIRVHNLTSKENHIISFKDPAYTTHVSIVHISPNKDFNTNKLIFTYSSLTTPKCQYEYDMDTKEKIVLSQSKVLGNFNQNNYQSERIFAVASDGKKIPISLVYNKNFDSKKPRPLLLSSYGAYGSFENLSFNSNRISLLDRGFVIAIAHVRGGQELGPDWYSEGKLLNKMNTFTDFISCAETLIKEGYTSNDKLFIQGGSMGGLLIGAVLNLRPDLFKGAIANVPFMDVLSALINDPFERGELGDPNEDEYYKYILAYSPYDNIKKKNYPAILVKTGFNDAYWEAAKYTAKLRDLNPNNNPIFLYTNMNTSHDGASGRYESLKEKAMEYAFLISRLD